jgi:hypothetical protein
MEQTDDSEVIDGPSSKVHNSVDTVEKPVRHNKSTRVHSDKRRRKILTNARGKKREEIG